MSEFRRLTHTFISGKFSTTIIIPIDLARKYGIDKPSNILVEGTNDGILIKKIKVE